MSQVHPDDRERLQELTEEALRTGRMDCEFRVLWPDGTVHWLQSTGKVYFESGEPVHCELIKSCGDWGLVQPSTMLTPPIRIKTYW